LSINYVDRSQRAKHYTASTYVVRISLDAFNNVTIRGKETRDKGHIGVRARD